MKAAVLSAYGGPENISITDLPDPAPGRGQVLVRLAATAVNSGDARMRAVNVPRGMGLACRLAMGWSAPRQPILGTEGAGVVVGLGDGASRFAPGDQVVVFSGMAMGCHAEMVAIHEDGKIIAKPAALSMHQAGCMMFGGLTALDFLRKAGLRAGEHVLINGASGTVGSAGVQMARALGAQVTGVTSTANRDLVAGLGAAVIDYSKGPIPVPAQGYDVVFDTVGNLPYAAAKPLLAANGRLIRAYAGLAEMITAPLTGRRHGHRVLAGTSAENPADMATLADWADAGLYRPLIDSILPFDAIADAHRRVDTGRKRGSVVVELSG